MNYYFTGVLILLMVLLALFGGPNAWGRNEFLNDYPNSCSTGSFDVRVSQEDRDGSYRHTSPSNNYNDYDDTLKYFYLNQQNTYFKPVILTYKNLRSFQ